MKRVRSFLSVLLSIALAGTIFATLTVAPAVEVSAAQAVAFSATRYRYPICRFENANYQTGVSINDSKASAYLFTDCKTIGSGSNDLFSVKVDKYNMFNMKLGDNKALHIVANSNTSPSVAEVYTSYIFHMGSLVGTSEKILPDNIQGIKEGASDHGIMFHYECTGLDGTSNGFTVANTDASDATKIASYSYHVARDINCTFQEWDYKANGKVRKKAGVEQASAYHVKGGAHVTLIWTKNIAWTNPDAGKDVKESKYTQQVFQSNGKPVLDKDGNATYENIPSYNHKAGEVQLWEVNSYDSSGQPTEGTINLPRDFCGYVIIPFSQFNRCWSSLNDDGYINLKKLNLANLYFGNYWNHQGQYWIDEYCFWGPTFAKVSGSYDYGANLSFSNHKDSLINRKEVSVKEVSTAEVSSQKAPATIKTAVTLTNAKTGVKLEAPTSAKISSGTKFTVTSVGTDDYTKQLMEKLCGADKSKYAAYVIFLGADGDQEPADFCQIDFPVPSGLDPTKCVVNLVKDEKLIPYETTLSSDKKTLSIKTIELGTFAITQTGSAAAASEASAVSEASEAEASVDVQSAVSTAADVSTATKGSANLTWLWIVIGVVVVAGAAVGVFFFLRSKKQGAEDGEADADDNGAAENPEDSETPDDKQ